MTLTIPLILLLLHFIGDFILQTDWMAINKSKSWDALAFHCGVYAFTFFIGLAWLGYSAHIVQAFLALTFITHFLTDAVTSRITSRLWFFKPYGESNMWWYIEGKRHWFFVVIGLDQFIHFFTLALTWSLLK